MRTSLHTALRAGSIVSPARRTDTPVICGGDEDSGLEDERREPGENPTATHPFPIVAAAFVLLTLRRLNYTHLPEKTDRKRVRV